MLVSGAQDLRRIAIPAFGPTFLFALGEGALIPIIPLAARGLGASVAVAAFVVTLIWLGSFAGNVPASAVAERFGERVAIVGAAVVSTVAVAIAMIASLPALMAGATLLGFAGSAFLLARQKYMTEAVAPAFRARALSTLGGVMRAGMLVGPFAGAAVVHQWGLRAAFVVCIAAIVLAGLVATMLPDLPQRPEIAAGPAPRVRDVMRSHAPVFLTVGTAVTLLMVVRSTRQVIVPLWADHLGLPASSASLVVGVANGVDMLMFYPSGLLMDRRGRAVAGVPMLVLMAAALVLMTQTASALPFALSACLLGLANGMGSGIVMTLGADFSPDNGRAAFLGVWRQLSDLGALSGPLLLSVVTGAAGLAAGIWAIASVALAGGAWLGRSLRTAARRKSPDHVP